MKKAIFFLVAVIFTGFVGVWFIAQNQLKSKPESQKLQVVTSFYPLYFFAKEIGKDKTMITNITPPGAEPHDFEPSTQDIVNIEKSDILMINGGGFEPWEEKMKENLKNKKVRILITGEGIIIHDPHVWIDPVLAKKVMENIVASFIKLDPTNTTYYQTNAEQLTKKLDDLDREFRQGLMNCSQKIIVTSHAAFGLLASRYQLQQISIAGFSPDSEPSPKQLAEIAQLARKNNVHYIFFENLVSPRLAETLAREIGAKTLVLNPMEGLTSQEESSGKDYFLLQRENLANLKIALECK